MASTEPLRIIRRSILIPLIRVWAVKGTKVVQRLQIALAQVKALFCQHHDAAAFRRFIGQR
jgi:hypothetical protein